MLPINNRIHLKSGQADLRTIQGQERGAQDWKQVNGADDYHREHNKVIGAGEPSRKEVWDNVDNLRGPAVCAGKGGVGPGGWGYF